ncbi:hypothetical protein [Aeromonas hydrophila]|uniref:hypothetical protein n=1 Tax=Aeromonas hydrophila TaxID=644 RepID=UPI0012D3F7B0|nr:hypothetical protein [Aeromonas hydrophila]
MEIRNFLVSLPLVFISAGCSTINYTEPQTGDLSRVRFATNETAVIVIRAYETTECSGETEWMRLRNGILINSSPKSLGIPLQNYNRNAFKEFYTASNTEKIVIFVGTSSIGNKLFSCGVPLNLKFLEKNKDYELFYQLGVNSCSVTASEIQKSPSGEIIKKKLKDYSNSQEGFGEACMALFKKQRLY